MHSLEKSNKRKVFPRFLVSGVYWLDDSKILFTLLSMIYAILVVQEVHNVISQSDRFMAKGNTS